MWGAAAPLGSAGCDGFRGSVLAMSVAFPPQLIPAPGAFVPLQMWAKVSRNGQSEYLRLSAEVGSADPATFTGFSVVRAIDPNDPCLIRALDPDDEACASPESQLSVCGTQAFSKPAQLVLPDSTPELAQLGLVLQARKVTADDTVFSAVDGTTRGRAPLPLLALVQYDPRFQEDPRRSLPPTTPQNAGDPTVAIARIAACRGFKNGPPEKPEAANSNFYVGNPRQYTRPLSGTLFGVFTFATCVTPTPPACPTATPDLPVQNFSGITFSVPMALSDIEELVVTVEPPGAVPPAAPTLSRQLYSGVRLPEPAAGRGVISMVMRINTSPPGDPPMFTTAVGTAAIITDLGARLD